MQGNHQPLPQAWARDPWIRLIRPLRPAPNAAVPGVPFRLNAERENHEHWGQRLRSERLAPEQWGLFPVLAGGSPGFNITFNNAFAIGGYRWCGMGKSGVVGGLTTPPPASQQWAYIKGPGPDDYVKFPDGSFSQRFCRI